MTWSRRAARNRRLIAGLVLVVAVVVLTFLYLPLLEPKGGPHAPLCRKFYETPTEALAKVQGIEQIVVSADRQWFPPGWGCTYQPATVAESYRLDPPPVRGGIALTSIVLAFGSVLVLATSRAATRQDSGTKPR